jgi:hypothetical protein
MICPHTLHPRLFRPSAMKTLYNTSRVLYVAIHFISERAGVFKMRNTTPPTHGLVGCLAKPNRILHIINHI